MDYKICKDCKENKSLDNYYAHHGQAGGYPACKDCCRIRNQKWREKNPEYSATYQREWTLNNKEKRKNIAKRSKIKISYNMTIEQLEEWRKKQDNRCAICKIDTPKGSGDFHIDHNHSTGKVRGLLCVSCNMAIGAFKEDTAILREAISYIERDGCS